jgi:hypothetical protein
VEKMGPDDLMRSKSMKIADIIDYALSFKKNRFSTFRCSEGNYQPNRLIKVCSSIKGNVAHQCYAQLQTKAC